jgi:hypothetical protein
MKTTKNSNSVLKTIAVTATAVLVLSGSPVSSFANSFKEKHTKSANTISESQVDVQYAGSADNTFTFKVKFENTAAQKFTLIVKNDEGDVIYSKEFSDAHFSKTIQLVKNEKESNDIHPTFAISSGGGSIERSFSIDK